jgi:hypothetical protein
MVPIIKFYMFVAMSCIGPQCGNVSPMMQEQTVPTIEECIDMVATSTMRILEIGSGPRTYRVGCLIRIPAMTEG